MNILRLLSFSLAIGFSHPGIAHTDAYLDSLTTPHGGQVRMAGSYHFELLVEKTQVTVYVTDHAFKPLTTKEVSGTATLVLNKQETKVELTPSGENKLLGKGDFVVTPQLEVVVSMTLNGQMQQARFKPWEKMQAKPTTESGKKEKAKGEESGEHHHE